MRSIVVALPSILSHPFVRNAMVAGIGIAAACGVVGYFVVLRGQVFTGDALSHVGFTGALAALAAGADLRLGLFGATIAVGAGMGLLGRRARADDVVIGSVFAWILGLGVLFLSIYTAGASGTNGTGGVGVLFGSILGLSASAAWMAAAIGAAVCLAVAVGVRPLLFASLDEGAAAAAGVPVRLVGLGFLVLVGVTAAEATQAVGALPLLGLLAGPAAAAQQLTDRPLRGVAVSAGIAVAAAAVGVVAASAISRVPPSFAIVTAAILPYWGCLAVGAARRRLRRSTGRGSAILASEQST